jgi:hypothetical protein
VTTLEEQFALLIAGVAPKPFRTAPDLIRGMPPPQRTRTVYSVGEAINQRGQNAKLGAGSNRDSGTGR